jgi:hypothetical protein
VIAKVTQGRGFQGLQAYLLAGKDGQARDRVAWIASRNLPSDDPELAARVMRATARESTRVEKPVYHLTISLPPDQQLEQAEILAVANRTLEDLGLQEHQVLIVAHDDTEHQHVHLMINRVHPETGRAWHPGHDYARIEKSLRQQERELELREVPGRHYTLPDQERHRGIELSSGDRRFTDRTSERPFAEHVREVARPDMREAKAWEELHRRLGEYGLRLEKRGRGLALTDGEHRVKASFVDRSSSLGRLQERLGPYQAQERDHFAVGRSERWQDVHDLRRTADGIARQRDAESDRRHAAGTRLDQHRADRDRIRLERRVDAATERLERSFGDAYRNPASARRSFDELRQAYGTRAAARELGQKPQRLGTLRGRGGPMPSAQRRQALEAARHGATAARDMAAAQGALARHVTSRGAAGTLVELTKAAAKAKRPAGKARAHPGDLARSALRLVDKLGWKLVARVVPVPHLLLLRVTLSLGRKAMEASLDLGKAAHR